MSAASELAVTIFILLLAALIARVYSRYQRDIRQACQRISVGSQVVETACGPIEYAIAGEGPPVLVVHGAGGGYDQGLDITEELVQKGFRVIAMSRFGYLRTPLPEDASATAQADAHACLLDALNITRAAVLGASAGAPSAVQFALRHPERTSALLLMVPAIWAPRPESTPPVQSLRGPIFLFDIALRSDFLFWAAIRLARKAMIRGILGTPPEVVESASTEEQARVAQVLDHILPVNPRRLGLLNEAAVLTSLPRYELEQISAPTLIMSSADDLYGTFAGAKYSAEHIPHARFIGYPTGGHMGVGHQQEVAAEMAAFLHGTGT
ncbi:MAG TPA: alpha/beta hydrolase [Gallionella sp.]|nr:alpha/beta hydrolase [Gallionella sp.]